MYYINDFEVGHEVDDKVEITEELHKGFVTLSGDDSPIHVDHDFCKRTSFGRPIGHAFLITTLLSKIYGKIFPGGSELCLSQTCNFKRPFFIGDTLNYHLRVIHKNVDLDLVTIKTEVRNQN